MKGILHHQQYQHQRNRPPLSNEVQVDDFSQQLNVRELDATIQ